MAYGRTLPCRVASTPHLPWKSPLPERAWASRIFSSFRASSQQWEVDHTPSYTDLIRRARISSRKSSNSVLLLLERRKWPLSHRRKSQLTNTLTSTAQSILAAIATKVRQGALQVQLLLLRAIRGLITRWQAIVCRRTANSFGADKIQQLPAAFELLPPAMGCSR